jgi:proteasome lid subunit RPN8/RPN11
MKFNTEIKRLYIDARAYEKLFHWVNLAKGEISCLGLVEDNCKEFNILDVFLIKQTCTSASTDMDQEDIAKLLFELEKQGKAEMLKCWIHSHGSMNVFWSSTDEATIKGLANDNFFISVVVNKNRDMLGRIDVFSPVRLMIDALEVHVLIPSFGLLDECKKEFTEKVKEDAGILMLTKDGKPDDLRDIWDPLFPDTPENGTVQTSGHFTQVPMGAIKHFERKGGGNMWKWIVVILKNERVQSALLATALTVLSVLAGDDDEKGK